MIVIAIISLIIFKFGLFCIAKEIVQINKTSLEVKRTKIHLSLLAFSFITWAYLLYWVLSHHGFSYGFNFHLIKENFWLFLIMASIYNISFSIYIRKQRLGEDLIISYSDEFRRTINFSFTKDLEFDEIVKRFSDKMKAKGLEVEYITEVSKDFEHLKYLKDGEIAMFSPNTYLEKVGDAPEHNYIFHNKIPLVITFHDHLLFSEFLQPLDKPSVLYLLIDKKIKRIPLCKNDTYTIPKGVKHAMIFSLANRTTLNWY